MIPAQEQILRAVEAAIKGITAIPGLTVARNRIEPPSEDEMPQVRMFQGPQEDATIFTGEDGYAQTVIFEGWVTGLTEQEAQLARTRLQAEIHKSLHSDVTLGGLARDIRPPDQPLPERLDLEPAPTVLGFEVAYVVEYATAEGDPYTLLS